MAVRLPGASRPSNIALPLTTMSAPQLATSATLRSVTPPSTPIRMGWSAASVISRAAAIRRAVLAAGACPGQPGLTASTSTRSIRSSTGSMTWTGVPGLIA